MIQELLSLQDEIKGSKPLLEVATRLKLLRSLRDTINQMSTEIAEALQKDLSKSPFEAYLSEIDIVQHELEYFIKNLKKWARPKKVRSPWTHFPAKSYVYSEPLGQVLVISPWNYPFQLALSPVAGAICAGNQVVLKPSEVSPHTSSIIKKVIEKSCDPKFVSVVEGGVPETTELLGHKFDHIFYTGNGTVARIIAKKAAETLTPVTLELGGKSPAAVFTKNLELAAKRIAWGKFFNVGQTCVAPDYVIVPAKQKADFVHYSKKWISEFYSSDASKSPDYGRIINQKHFDRICSYIETKDVLAGNTSDRDKRFFAPTIVSADFTDPVMQEEIFGPVLPIVEVDSLSEAIKEINKRDKPLSAYGFLDSETDKKLFATQVSAGGMVINDVMIHLSNVDLPFGGVGESGMGNYHGKYSFDCFSHQKTVLKRSFLFENSLRYPPYRDKLSFIRKFISLLGQ